MNNTRALVPGVDRGAVTCSTVVRSRVDRPRRAPLGSSRPHVRVVTATAAVFEGKRSDVTGVRGKHDRADSHELPARQGLGVFLFVP